MRDSEQPKSTSRRIDDDDRDADTGGDVKDAAASDAVDVEIIDLDAEDAADDEANAADDDVEEVTIVDAETPDDDANDEASEANADDDADEQSEQADAAAKHDDSKDVVADADAKGDTSAKDAEDSAHDGSDRSDKSDESADAASTDDGSARGGFHPIRTVKRQWKRFTDTKFYQVWNKRPKFSYGAYLCVMFSLVLVADMMLLWSIDTKHMYDPQLEHSFFRQILDSSYHSLSSTAGILNFFALAMAYLVCVTVINRFWVGTAVFGALAGVYAFACKIKYAMRTEPILPSDLGFLGGGGGGDNVASFVTDEYRPIIDHGVPLIVWFVVVCIVLQFLDRRRAFIHCSWLHPIRNMKNVFGNICRVAAPVLSIWLIVSYAGGLSSAHSSIREFVNEIGYSPIIWNVGDDARANGAATTFLSLTRVKAMEEEPGYDEAMMRTINDRYAKQAKAINAERDATLTDTTVINVLSETFSDPNRVPGVHFNVDPMPNVRALGDTTTSGLMLSPGYGGGTANIEFQQMTGLSMANFNGSLLSPYQQLLPTRPEVFSFNQMWNDACGSDSCSVAFHPFLQRFYLRNANYRKFGFSHLYTLDSNPKIKYAGTYEGKSGKSGNVTDEQAYRNVVDEVKKNASADKPAQFIELVTMQNHAPYPGIYGDENEFFAANESEVPDGEKGVIANYAKGLQRTDEATRQFLDELDMIDKPITVVFYGDHLPGIYTTAVDDPKNSLALHETDYFIWSNKASAARDVQLPAADAAYSSSNYFMAQTAQQLNARVSPYLALLTELHKEIPALSRAVTNGGTWSADASITYLDAEGKEMDPKHFSKKAKQLLNDYRVVQYDMMMGRNYLRGMGFMDLPKR
ncbi:LTA synthase family protein [Bifidobacterium choerinum]|uniref:LTA synthase family protein n=1 Tax=Bifidobacterium choerinum TaxID=35760 RepID=UPI000C1A6D12|nr:LTA synthase family protein [Bifidobacterium choerinum]